FHRVGNLDVTSRRTRELLGHVERLRQETLYLSPRTHGKLVVFAELVDTKNRDDVLQILISLQRLLHRLRDVVVFLADNARIENARCRSQRIYRGINSNLSQSARKHGGRVEVSKRRRRSGIGQVVGGNVNRLHRSDRAFLRRCNALLQFAHFCRQIRLIDYSAGHAAQQRRHFRASLREAENVVDEEQSVRTLSVAEVFSNRQSSQRHPQTSAGRLRHLTIDERG